MRCLEVSGAVRPIYGSLGFKGLITNENIPNAMLVCGVKTTFHIFDTPITLE